MISPILRNHLETRSLRVYVQCVGIKHIADLAHPCFQFVGSEILKTRARVGKSIADTHLEEVDTNGGEGCVLTRRMLG